MKINIIINILLFTVLSCTTHVNGKRSLYQENNTINNVNGNSIEKTAMINGAIISVTKHNFNAGKVTKGEPLNYNFYYSNNGDRPLLITKIRTSCHCTVASYSKIPLMPGDSSIISINMDTEHPGSFDKKVAIYSNAINDYDSTINSSRIIVLISWKVISSN